MRRHGSVGRSARGPTTGQFRQIAEFSSSRVTCRGKIEVQRAIGSRTEPEQSCIQQGCGGQQAVQPVERHRTDKRRIEFRATSMSVRADLAHGSHSLPIVRRRPPMPARRKRPARREQRSGKRATRHGEHRTRRTWPAREASAHQGKASLRAISASTRDSSENGARRKGISRSCAAPRSPVHHSWAAPRCLAT